MENLVESLLVNCFENLDNNLENNWKIIQKIIKKRYYKNLLEKSCAKYFGKLFEEYIGKSWENWFEKPFKVTWDFFFGNSSDKLVGKVFFFLENPIKISGGKLLPQLQKRKTKDINPTGDWMIEKAK